MPYLTLIRRVLACSLFIFFILTATSQGAEVDANLFTPYEGPLQLDPSSVNSSIVSRQRLVSIQFESLPMTEGQSAILNLFDDVVVRAICDSLELDVSGGFIWNGYIQGPSGGLVTLSVAHESMAGTVEIAPFTYLIRPFQEQVYVIREIQPPVYRSALSLSDGAPSSEEQEVVRLVNLERGIENLHPLIWDNALATAARGHSIDMSQQDYFSHTSLDGRLFHQRITAAGYPYSTCGENIASGYSTPQAVMNGWMNSPGHRANILNSAFCDIGVGYAFGSASTYKNYWTQDFGRRSGVSVCANNTNPDNDNDGMLDSWETSHGLNPLVNDANLDKDGDGLTNLQEYMAGTDPSSPNTVNQNPTPPATPVDGGGGGNGGGGGGGGCFISTVIH